MGMYAVQTADSGDLAALADVAREGRHAAMARRRAVAAGRSALAPGRQAARTRPGTAAPPPPATPAPPPPPAVQGGQAVPAAPPSSTGGVADAHVGRTLSMERRRQLSQGKRAVGADGGPATGATHGQANGSAPPAAGQAVPAAPPSSTGGVADAHVGRTLSMERRRQLSQGKHALVGARPAHDGAGTAPEQDRARPAEVSQPGAGASSPGREGRVTYAPKVVLSPTHGGQRVTGLRIGPGARVTGDEAGAALPVSGSQYIAADGPSPSSSAGRKVGQVRTPQGLVVSGTTVRNKVAITGDEAGEHLRITGEAEPKLDDDLTPREDGTYRSAQFPRRADPHGATAVGTRLAPPRTVVRDDGGRWHPLENTDGGLAVTGTAVGRSGRVTGNEAGACRPITGDQYQHLASYSSECGGTGGGTAPAPHLNRARIDPVTGAKVTVAQTWGGQRVTGPNVEHGRNVTGDEPGVCRPVTGTPYQGPSTVLGWCEPDESEPTAQRLVPRPQGVAVTGDLPMPAKAVTGTERGQQRNVTGTPYYRDLRAAEPASDDWTSVQAFPVALARRLAGEQSDGPATQKGEDVVPASGVPGRITGSFAVGDGKVTGNNEFLFRARPNRGPQQPVVTGEGSTEGRTITGSAWTAHDRVTGTEGYIAAGRNPSEGGGGRHGWAGAAKFRDRATPGDDRQNVTGLSGWSPKAAARVTLSGGAQG
ncbi:MAG: CsoS2 family carboxysome shell protein [Actinomycetota bacterium]